jgi:dolichol-phosphate mannosyltransferase
MKKILIFTATYNEKNNIQKLIKEIKKNAPKSDLLIIDDNSPDGTADIIKKIIKIKRNNNIKLILRKKKDGLDTAHKLAYKYALINGYDYLITMDADLSHDPSEIPNFIKHLLNNDFVLGSRYMKGGRNELKLFRFLLSYLGNKFIKYTLNLNFTEFTSSYRAFNLKKLEKFNLKMINSKGYSFFMETIFQLNKMNFKACEIPIIFATRKQGKSKIPKIEIIRTLFNVIRLYFAERK